MPNKKTSGTGVFALATGLLAGAAAVFFSNKENRKMVKKELVKVEKQAVKMTKEVKKDPKKFAKKVQSNGKKLATKVVKAEKKLVKKASKSPALKAVGKKLAKKK